MSSTESQDVSTGNKTATNQVDIERQGAHSPLIVESPKSLGAGVSGFFSITSCFFWGR